MIKIKLYEADKHRNECTFRPFIYAQNSIREIGIEFTKSDSYDYAWVAQASITNQNVSYEQSINEGLEFLSKISGKYMIIDGQDSTALYSTYDVFKQSDALLLLKNSLLKDKTLYNQYWNFGRYYWGPGEYSIKDFDQYSDRIVLSGTNWLLTHWAVIEKYIYPINRARKYDICGLFQYPLKNHMLSECYNEHRKPAVNVINNLRYNVTKLNNGERIPIEDYYRRFFDSKIVIAPFGAGEMAPRDIETILFGNILIKPDMSYVETAPDLFEDLQTYIACKHDYSDLEEKIDMVLGNYDYYSYIIENGRKRLLDIMHPDKVALHLYSIFNKIL